MMTKKTKHPREIEAKHDSEIRKKLLEAQTLEQECEKRTPEILKDNELLINIVNEVQKEGVAGEEDTIIAETIIATTRLVKKATPESKNLFLSDKTGIGKDYVTKKTLAVILPRDKHLHVTKMSAEAFTYWHYGENFDWDDKVIHFEDITESVLNCSTFKVMASGDSYAVVVKDQKTIEIPIKGKPVMILTSHHANPEDEALRRFPIAGLNESLEQTKKIKEQISKIYAKRETPTEDTIFRYAIRTLQPHHVMIPYAELIQHFFPEDILMRTHYHRFLDYICASAVLHQHQRKKTRDGELIATPDDYMIARMVLIYTTSNPKMIPMSKEYRDLLQLLKEHVSPMTVLELLEHYPKSKDWLYKHLPSLVSTGLVRMGTRYEEKANKNIFTYQYAPEENPNAIPTWNGITQKILKIINKTNKTNKTPQDSLLEKWFSEHKIKPIKPKGKKDEVEVVLFGYNNTFNREVLLVFGVLLVYLRERDEKRYKKYYQEQQEKKISQEKSKKPHKINDLRQFCMKAEDKLGHVSATALYDNFLHSDVDQAIASGLLVKVEGSDENYRWIKQEEAEK